MTLKYTEARNRKHGAPLSDARVVGGLWTRTEAAAMNESALKALLKHHPTRDPEIKRLARIKAEDERFTDKDFDEREWTT